MRLETDRQRQRDRETDRDRQTDRETDRYRQTDRYRERDRETETDRQRQRQTDRVLVVGHTDSGHTDSLLRRAKSVTINGLKQVSKRCT